MLRDDAEKRALGRLGGEDDFDRPATNCSIIPVAANAINFSFDEFHMIRK
jgi:hypothetical protein